MWNLEPICFALSVLSSVHLASQKDLNAFAKRIGGPRGFLKCPLKMMHLSVSLDGLKSQNSNWELCEFKCSTFILIAAALSH